MTQNRSHAVMSQRHEAHDSLDHFPTPPWAVRALLEWMRPGRPDVYYDPDMTCWEPACAEGFMARTLGEYFAEVLASDVHDYGYGGVSDFLFPAPFPRLDWIITNPPFRLAAEFVRAALNRADCGVAMLVRTAFLEGGGRHAELFAPHPPAWVLQFCERVPMVKGRLDPTASSATAYCWIVWSARPLMNGTRFGWLEPCRKRLERPGDYDAPATAEAAE